MPKLFGKEYTEMQLRERVGTMDQLGGVERIILAEGNSTGIEAYRIRTGGGLDATVLATRGMDIGPASYRGYPLAWQSATGQAHAAFFEPEGLSWLRTFHGGLVCTCGLTYAGSPCIDGEQALGLHGRVSHIPARHLASGAYWRDGEYFMYVEGEVREAIVFGENIVMKRTITAVLGQPELHILDVVTNDAFAPQEHMLVYHINFGFPLMDADTELICPHGTIEGRTPYAQETIARSSRFAPPTPDMEERVYYHQLKADDEGNTTVALVNRELGDGLAVYLTWDVRVLPHLVQWKMPAQGTYVTGLEPANCRVEGRAIEREKGRLQVMQPGEVRRYPITIGVVEGARNIDQLIKRIKAI